MHKLGLLENKIRIGIIDGGFIVNADFPDTLQFDSTSTKYAGIGTTNPGDCGDGNPCHYHGTSVVSAAMAEPPSRTPHP